MKKENPNSMFPRENSGGPLASAKTIPDFHPSSFLPHPFPDRIGLGWRPQLAIGILSNLDRIDILEVMADDFLDAPAKEINALKTLAAQRPVILHGVSLGMASTHRVEVKRLEKFARLIEKVKPETWSEHLAFVRAGGIEIGHLAAPPRTDEVILGTLENLETARKTTGIAPFIENVATLIDPPGSRLTEAEWLNDILGGCDNDLLLDLHNLYANGINFDFDPMDVLGDLPLERVGQIHLAGGKWVTARQQGGRRLLDDHLHDVPEPVFRLLEEVAFQSPRALTVTMERDGAFPPFTSVLREIEAARQAVSRGRQRRNEVAE